MRHGFGTCVTLQTPVWDTTASTSEQWLQHRFPVLPVPSWICLDPTAAAKRLLCPSLLVSPYLSAQAFVISFVTIVTGKE